MKSEEILNCINIISTFITEIENFLIQQTLNDAKASEAISKFATSTYWKNLNNSGEYNKDLAIGS